MSSRSDVEGEPPAGDVDASRALPEVKTLTFVTLREFLPEYFDEVRFAAIRAGLSRDARDVLDNAMPGLWTAEAHMCELMRVVYDTTLSRDDDAYSKFARALAACGISRFMKIFLSLASERFVLRKVPVVWRRLRRNAGSVTASVEGDRIELHYEGFPHFGRPFYRLLSLANCEALVFAATQRIPDGAIKAWSEDSLVLEFQLAG